MAGSIITAVITADARKFSSEMDKVGQQMGRWGSTLTRKVTLPILGIGGAAFKMASDLAEASSQAATVFGGEVGKIETAARDMGDAFSEADFLAMASRVGNMAQGMGIARTESDDLALSVLDLAQDLASFNNVPVERAVNAVTTALTGEREALKSLGIVINEEMVNVKALEMGLTDSTGEVDAAAKAMATMQLITEGAGTAIGDFDRTSGEAANQTRILTANFKDAAAKLGTDLLPLGMQLLEWANDLVGAFTALDPTIQTVIIGVAGVAAAIGPLLTVGSRLIGVGGKLATVFSSLGVAGSAAAVGLGAAAVVIGQQLIRQSQRAEQNLSAMTTAIEEQDSVAGGLRTKVADLADDYEPLRKAMRNADVSTNDLTAAIMAGGDELEAMKLKLFDAGNASLGVEVAIDGLIEAFGDARAEMATLRTEGEESRRNWDRYKGSTDEADASLGEIQGTADDTAGAVAGLDKAWDDLVGAFLGGLEVEANTHKLLEDIETAIDNIDKSSLGEIQGEVFDLTSQTAALMEAAGEQGVQGDLAGFFAMAQEGIKKLATEGDLTEQQMKDLERVLSRLNTMAINIPLGTVDVGVGRLGVPRFATGGIVTSPTLALIGEAGPEAVVPLSGPNAGMAGSTTVVVELDGEVLLEAIARADRRSGGTILGVT